MKEIFHPPPTREPIDRARYGGQYVAIWHREIIDSDVDGAKLIERLRARGIEGEAGIMAILPPGMRRL